ncbi:ADP-ribosylation factor GTPase-activating protein AGD3-like isoform X2 [Trifolium pratense]|uniref:ADP-ribosylation factor GTPase-activating protein AGD3-like isoform X2 n=1 Tax=Trifolium pratense TaxID=57577 RepID=UPI001E69752E|nr:ADP-ribosylation factor GTPase-activating protein AGD3-like isoform X2 [Trifolium pratense]
MRRIINTWLHLNCRKYTIVFAREEGWPIMQFLLNKVKTIRQGYLSKRSSNLRGTGKGGFFVLDSRGKLYYYRKQCSKLFGSSSQHFGQRNSLELGFGLLSRQRTTLYK